MRIGILGDIHGNHLALKAVLGDMKKEKVDQLLCTGDCVGYYYHPDEVFDLLAEWPIEFVKGNHEEIFIKIRNGNEELRGIYKKRLGSGLEHAMCKLDGSLAVSIEGMPAVRTIMISGKKVLLCHGSPWDVEEYIYPDSSLERFRRLSGEGYDAIVMGHTHYPMVKLLDEVLLVNPGSVGQTRTPPGGAHWAVLDTEDMKVLNKVTRYDFRPILEEAAKNDPDMPYLRDVLRRFDLGKEVDK